MNASWQSARDRFEREVLPVLRRIGKEIGAASENDSDAKEIIRCYAMLSKSFDPMTLILLEKALGNYQSKERVLPA